MSSHARLPAEDILIVDDEADIRTLVAGILDDEGFQAREAGDSDATIAAVNARRPGLVLLDIWLQGSKLDGMGLLEHLKREHPSVPVVMMSGHGTIETAVQAIKLGAYDFIEKPFKTDRMILVVRRAIEAARLKRENEELRLRAGPITDLIGASAVVAHLRQAIDRVAPTNSRVLLSGPAGAGKEAVARLIHARSRRSEGPFTIVNCASMAPDRMEVELFGIEGSGSAAAAGHKVGLFEAAHNGTLFLDEVADLPQPTQSKIVRVLQEQTFMRVGGQTRVEVDVRVIAATSKDLTEEIQAGHFREDLFYRLAVVPLKVPGLTERREDIPLLARHFMTRAAETAGQRPRELSEDAIAVLQTYNWPGNVRELRNIIERILIMAPGAPEEVIRADMLPAEISEELGVGRQADRAGEIMGLPLKNAREMFEREYLVAQVTRFGGNISRTAAFVGMERSALHRKLKSLGIQTDDRVRVPGSQD
ncbi:MAG: sigma-54-dependent Fis family transcriptional regulator [Rhodospirillales bacterium]|nr:sigma-54-dependent Fis family transcriptional regulator [Rhodospirillales bacterium]MDG4604178.1 sigma-54 dependent transcriptional regulator [Defluviicoccus sp.]MDG4608779.1 sigma-54 dependent transcriptional regulator [Defluviicoccus sp.]